MNSDMQKAYYDDYYTIIVNDLQANYVKKEYENILKQRKIGTPQKIFIWSGEEINREFDLIPPYNFKSYQKLICFSDKGLNFKELFRLCESKSDKWFTELIDERLKLINLSQLR